ncbi:MAG TPA: DedA family protein [Hyphomicrobiaceae bacterium]|nr:DedA family protein [Hyphomicrobiaceae bacterium]
MKETVDAILAFVRNNQAYAAPVVFLLAFGESIAFVSLILPFWGMLVAIGAMIGAAGTLDFWTILVAAAVGAALGDWVSYWLGYHYHEQIARMWPINKYPDLLPRGHRFFEKYGAWAIVAARFSGPLRASVPIVAGAVEMPRAKFQLANWASAFLWAWVLLTFGESLGEGFNWLSERFGKS